MNNVNFMPLTFYRIRWKGLHSAPLCFCQWIGRQKKNQVFVEIKVVNSILCKPYYQGANESKNEQ